MTDAEQVQAWYESHRSALAAEFARTELRVYNAEHSLDGKVCIALEGNQVTATITFWNKGDVEVQRLDLQGNDDPVVIDDRKRSTDESVASLLDGYLEAIRRLSDR